MKKIFYLIIPITLCACGKKYTLDVDAKYCHEDKTIISQTERESNVNKFFICDQKGGFVTGTVADGDIKYTVKNGVVTHVKIGDSVEFDTAAAFTGKPDEHGLQLNVTEYHPSGRIKISEKRDGACDKTKSFAENGEMIWSEFRCDTNIGVMSKLTFYKTSVGIIDFDFFVGKNEYQSKFRSFWYGTKRGKYDEYAQPKALEGTLKAFDSKGRTVMVMDFRKGVLNGKTEVFDEDEYAFNSKFVRSRATVMYKDGVAYELHAKYKNERTRWNNPKVSYDEEILKNGKVTYLLKGKLVAARCETAAAPIAKDPEKVKCK
jgi:antitoxin component YwqK of YwqJK toxin-antitoxin module